MDAPPPRTRPRRRLLLNNYSTNIQTSSVPQVSQVGDDLAVNNEVSGSSSEVRDIPCESHTSSNSFSGSDSKKPELNSVDVKPDELSLEVHSAESSAVLTADNGIVSASKAERGEVIPETLEDHARTPFAKSEACDGFFHHRVVQMQGATVTMRGNKIFVGSSKTPREATSSMVERRTEWLIEKRVYERRLLDKQRKKSNFIKNLGGVERDDASVPEHYIPQALPLDEEELFAGLKERETGRYIDDCMEETLECSFLGLAKPAPVAPVAVFTVEALHLPRKIAENLLAMGITDLLPIQRQVIPLVRDGFDVIGTSPTGSGKTAAFLVPIIEDIYIRKGTDLLAKPSTKALILCPTRELADQIYHTVVLLSSSTEITCVAVYGAIDSQFLTRRLQTPPDIIVGTPGRMLDVINVKMVSLLNVRYLVVDEVDRMISCKSFPEVTEILDNNTFPGVNKRQTLFFSATVPEDETIVLRRNQARPFYVRVGEGGLPIGVTHIFEKTQGYYEKIDRLRIHLDTAVSENKSVIVFGGTKDTVDRLHGDLKSFSHLISHGLLSQSHRADVLRRFSSQEIPVLVVTDLCSRGLDFEKVNLIINFSMPRSSADYVHRIGRTGRVGHVGTAVTFYDATSKWDGNSLEFLVDKLKVNGISFPTWIDQEINLIRHKRLNSMRCPIQKEELTCDQDNASDLADLNIFLCWPDNVPVITNEWLREW